MCEGFAANCDRITRRGGTGRGAASAVAAFAQQPWYPDADPAHYGPPGHPPPFLGAIAIMVGVLLWGGALFLIGRAIYRYWHPGHMKGQSAAQKGWGFLQICVLIGGILVLLVLIHAL